MIARQDDCQTCFLCEIYCPTDALYVAPNAEGPTAVSEAEIEAAGLFGSYARALGWRPRPARRQRKRPDLPAARRLALTGAISAGRPGAAHPILIARSASVSWRAPAST